MNPITLIFAGFLLMGLGMVMYPNPDYATILLVKCVFGITAVTAVERLC